MKRSRSGQGLSVSALKSLPMPLAITGIAADLTDDFAPAYRPLPSATRPTPALTN